MKSPFPGMDPYLEARWSDVHATLIAFIKESLQQMLPNALRARSEQRVLLESTADDEDSGQSYRSDVAVVDSGKPGSGSSQATALLEVAPMGVQYYDEPAVERWIQIIDRSSGNRLITAIEVLSPWNKGPGKLNTTYRQKLTDYKRASVSIVEIDLLRYPPRSRLEIDTGDLPFPRRTPYMVGVHRPWKPYMWDMFPLPLRDPLPHIPIPLRPIDAEIVLHLQPLIDRVYVAGGHDDIDYRKPADPPLSPEDTEWAKGLLNARAAVE